MNSCHITTKNLKPGIFLVSVECSLTTNLLAEKYVPFKANLMFAGISLRGALLSKKQAGTANIDGIPVVSKAKSDWLTIQGDKVLANTYHPEIVIEPNRRGASIFINPKHIIDRYQLKHSYRLNSFATELDTALWFHAHHPASYITQTDNDFDVVIPKNYQMPTNDWLKLAQHNFTHKKLVSAKYVVPIEGSNQFKLKAHTIEEVLTNYGVKGQLVAREKDKLAFNKLTVLNPMKACKINPILEFIQHAHVYHTPDPHIYPESILRNPRLASHIKQCKEEWNITPDFSRIAFDWQTIPVELLDFPLVTHAMAREPIAFIPPQKLDTYFLPVHTATRTHHLDKIVKYRINLKGNGKPEFGFYVAKKELENAPIKDKQAEKKRIQERADLFQTKYQLPLPENWEEANDQNLHAYFTIQTQLRNGDVIPLSEFQLIPPDTEDVRQPFDSWLRDQDIIVTCPISRRDYIKNIISFDELVDIPGFIDTLCQACGQKAFLARILLSDKVKAHIISQNL
jgi:hypothetical protein